eukprot:TRINITY_DN7453_c0_g1_i1.p1 TRINITY_DN7453_c0_g1~~TRINITY_DN7453_c0_g1_i1.p1  ORF type:complete len:232 (+),score=46.84 TRINITY_DN7453_c0_g1_i1:86-697(+)
MMFPLLSVLLSGFNTSSYTQLFSVALYCLIILIGIRGARTLDVRMLRFYWIFQFTSLLLILVGLIMSLAFLGMSFHRQQDTKPTLDHQKDVPVHHNRPHVLFVDPTLSKNDDQVPEFRDDPKKADNEFRFKDLLPHKGAKNDSLKYSVTSAILPSLFFALMVMIKTYSIVLARQLIHLIESGDETLVESGCSDKCCSSSKGSK